MDVMSGSISLGKLKKDGCFASLDPTNVVAVAEAVVEYEKGVISTFFYIMENKEIAEPLDCRGEKLSSSIHYPRGILDYLRRVFA